MCHLLPKICDTAPCGKAKPHRRRLPVSLWRMRDKSPEIGYIFIVLYDHRIPENACFAILYLQKARSSDFLRSDDRVYHIKSYSTFPSFLNTGRTVTTVKTLPRTVYPRQSFKALALLPFVFGLRSRNPFLPAGIGFHFPFRTAVIRMMPERPVVR